MKNIFVVNTPFHLLTAFILQKSCFKNDENYLVLIRPSGYEQWHYSKNIKYMASKECGYKEVYYLINFLSRINKKESYRSQVKKIKNTIGCLSADNIFVGNDLDPKNQLFIASLEFNKFYRFEDGLYSYYNKNRYRPLGKVLFDKIKMNLQRKLYGIKGKIDINTLVDGNHKDAISDYMYKPNLLQRYSPNTIEITRDNIQTGISELVNKKILYPELKSLSAIYFSQPLVEGNILSIEDELKCLKDIVILLGNNFELLYKPHPHDNKNKIKFFKERIPSLKIFNSMRPAELSYSIEKNLKIVFSYQSTALMYVDKFACHSIKSISLSDYNKIYIHPKYKEILINSGVIFPKDIKELEKVIY